MKRIIFLANHSTGRKFRMFMNPEPVCLNCNLNDKSEVNLEQGFPKADFIPERIEVFDHNTKVLRVKCGRCKNLLGEYPAEELKG